MATIHLPPDFKEFFQLLNSHKVHYLVIGGYAVAYHGYPRATGDIDIWITTNPDNAKKIVQAIKEFGFADPDISEEIFLKEDQVIRMGVPPLRIELLTTISGVDFKSCYANRIDETLDDVTISFIGLEDLKQNKKASGRHIDLNDLERLP
ncbi:MAG: hypothetical protein IIC76_05740 [Bacteroidetes bacterium]|nr:hypothetical protein [Bacteroidota bacterium]